MGVVAAEVKDVVDVVKVAAVVVKAAVVVVKVAVVVVKVAVDVKAVVVVDVVKDAGVVKDVGEEVGKAAEARGVRAVVRDAEVGEDAAASILSMSLLSRLCR